MPEPRYRIRWRRPDGGLFAGLPPSLPTEAMTQAEARQALIQAFTRYLDDEGDWDLDRADQPSFYLYFDPLDVHITREE